MIVPAQPTAPTELAEVAACFDRLFGLLRRLTPEPLSLTAASTLRRLADAGEQRLSGLAAAEGVTQPAMTQLVSRLERDGLVARAGHPTDGRVVLVRITDAGHDMVRRRVQARYDRLGELLGRLSPAERAAVLAAVPALDRLGALARSAAHAGSGASHASGPTTRAADAGREVC